MPWNSQNNVTLPMTSLTELKNTCTIFQFLKVKSVFVPMLLYIFLWVQHSSCFPEDCPSHTLHWPGPPTLPWTGLSRMTLFCVPIAFCTSLHPINHCHLFMESLRTRQGIKHFLYTISFKSNILFYNEKTKIKFRKQLVSEPDSKPVSLIQETVF